MAAGVESRPNADDRFSRAHHQGRDMKTRTTARYCVAGLAIGIFSQMSAAADVPAASVPIVLKAAHLFDAISGNLVDHGVIVVSGNKIQAVGSDARIPADAKVI